MRRGATVADAFVRAHQVLVRVSEFERARVVETSALVALPMATFLREVALGGSPRCERDRESVADVFRINGDCGRLAGLLKWRLSDRQAATDLRVGELRELLGEVIATREVLLSLSRLVRVSRRDVPGHRLGTPWCEQTGAKEARRRSIHVPVRSDELQQLRLRASGVRMPLSTYIRGRGLVFRPTVLLSPSAVQDMLDLRSEVNRLGGLLRLWITDDPRLADYPHSQVSRTVGEALRRVASLQRQIRELAQGQIRELGRAA